MRDAPNRSERRRLRRRQRLIDAARQIIADEGVSALTIGHVTEVADMAVGSFYTYFDNKEDLLEAAVWDVFQQLASPELPSSLPENPLDHAYNAIHQVYEFVETQRDLVRAVFGAGHLADQFDRGHELISERITFVVEQYGIIPPEDVPWIAALQTGLIAGGIGYAIEHPDVSAEEMTERTLKFIVPVWMEYAQGGE
jgi:AcrR family transcriptional regulator